MGTIIDNVPCPECQKAGRDTDGDNLCMYEDGGGYCHACHYIIRSDGSVSDVVPADSEFKHPGKYQSLPERRIREEVCRVYHYTVTDNGTHISPYYDEGKLVAQHFRKPPKTWATIGNPTQAELFGQHTCRGEGGKRLVITEGQIDCLSVAQVTNHFDVVSIPNGVMSAEKSVRRNLEFINQYEEVYLCFDNDEPGREAVDSVKELIAPGKVRITSLKYKDPNEYLVKGDSKSLVDDLWKSARYKPSGIISSSDLQITLDVGDVLSYPSPHLNSMMLGREIHTMTLLVSGTGSGKSTNVRDQLRHDLESGVVVGGVFLEETPTDTANEIVSMRINRPVRKILRQRAAKQLDPDMECRVKDDLTPEVFNPAWGWVQSRPLHLYNPKDPPTPQNVLARLEYMAVGLGCRALYLDHLNEVLVKDMKELEMFVSELRALMLRIPAHLTVVSQLNQGEAKTTFEEGERPTIRNIRGSQLIPSRMHEILALVRNQQGDTEDERNTSNIYCLKARLGGETGYVESRTYDPATSTITYYRKDDPATLLPTHEPADPTKLLETLDDQPRT